jgi:uncharacterized membrane protein
MTKAATKSGKTGGAASAGAPDVPKVRTTPLNRLALWITEHVGTMQFFLVIFAWTVIWLFWNMFAPKALRFDPFPGFVLWLFISNMIQLFLMPLLMIGQNLQGRGAEERAKNDYKVNRKAEIEIQQVQAQLKAILERLDEMKGEVTSKDKESNDL